MIALTRYKKYRFDPVIGNNSAVPVFRQLTLRLGKYVSLMFERSRHQNFEEYDESMEIVLEIIDVILPVITIVTGLTSAWFWGKASRVKYKHREWYGNKRHVESMHEDPGKHIEALYATLATSGNYNKSAARWTAITVILTATPAFINTTVEFVSRAGVS